MKLLVDARVGWGHGIGRVVANTIPRVGRLRPNWRLDVLVPPERMVIAKNAFAAASNVQVVPSAVAPFSLAEQHSLARHAQGYDLTWFTNYWVPLMWRGPFVATVHDVLHLLPELAPASPLKRALARQTFAKVRRDARAVMFVSRFTEREFRRMIGNPRSGVTVPNGGDHLEYGPLRPIGARTRRLLVVAAAKQHKNFPLLFEAWRRARVGPDWRLTVVSPPREALLNSIDLDGLAAQDGRTDVLRNVSNSELAALYADSAILLMPSLYEGFGLPLLEGVLAGALCISANAGAMVEVAEGAFVQFVNGADMAGWVTAIEQTCATIDNDDLDLQPLLHHNIRRVADFRWERTAAEAVAVLAAAA